MTTKQGLIISFKTTKWMALIFFVVGTLLFLLRGLANNHFIIIILGRVFIAFAAVFNSIILIILLVDLIRKDRLESFYAICIVLANIPIAITYAYIILEYINLKI